MSGHRWIRKETVGTDVSWNVYENDMESVESFWTEDDAIRACAGWDWDTLPEVLR